MSFVQTAMQSAEEMRAVLTQKAMDDPEFRAELIANPKEVMSREFGIQIPEEYNIMVHESNGYEIHLALPTGPDLTEEQLEAISAGLSCCV